MHITFSEKNKIYAVTPRSEKDPDYYKQFYDRSDIDSFIKDSEGERNWDNKWSIDNVKEDGATLCNLLTGACICIVVVVAAKSY